MDKTASSFVFPLPNLLSVPLTPCWQVTLRVSWHTYGIITDPVDITYKGRKFRESYTKFREIPYLFYYKRQPTHELTQPNI
jgi:hypothetical protein